MQGLPYPRLLKRAIEIYCSPKVINLFLEIIFPELLSSSIMLTCMKEIKKRNDFEISLNIRRLHSVAYMFTIRILYSVPVD